MKAIKRPKARENADDYFVIGFGFASDWFSKRVVRVFRTNHKAISVTFDTQL